jgi:preprotein translocase subunit SecA
VIPTNMPMIRTDFPDVIYKTRKEKFDAAIEEIKALNKKASRCWWARSPSTSPSSWPKN